MAFDQMSKSSLLDSKETKIVKKHEYLEVLSTILAHYLKKLTQKSWQLSVCPHPPIRKSMDFPEAAQVEEHDGMLGARRIHGE